MENHIQNGNLAAVSLPGSRSKMKKWISNRDNITTVSSYVDFEPHFIVYLFSYNPEFAEIQKDFCRSCKWFLGNPAS